MNVNRTSRIAVAGLFLSMVSAACIAQGNNSSYDPLTQRRSPKQTDGFVDSTLKRINPCDTDYGQHLDELRKMVLKGTIEKCLLLVQHRISRVAWRPLHHHCSSARSPAKARLDRGGNARATRALPVTCECTGRGGHAEKLRPDGGIDSTERVRTPFSSASRRLARSFPSVGAAKPNIKHTTSATITSEGRHCQTDDCEHGKRSDNDPLRQSDRTLQTGG